MLLRASGLGRVRVGRGGVRVPEDYTDCASRGRPFFLRRYEFALSDPRRVCVLLKASVSGQVRVGRKSG